jgi:sporulation protein YqfC
MKNKNIREALASALDFPEEATGETKVTASGRNSLSIENYKSILEYDNNVIRIMTPESIIAVIGCGLSICAVTDCDIYICGKITEIRWE